LLLILVFFRPSLLGDDGAASGREEVVFFFFFLFLFRDSMIECRVDRMGGLVDGAVGDDDDDKGLDGETTDDVVLLSIHHV
jgi:hypothetical protein